MPRLRDVLERLRPAGIPGAASRAGVPADRAAELATELAGVFDALEPVEAECAAIRETAERDARDIIRRAHDQAEAMIAEARAKVEAERASATAEADERASADHEAVVTDAERLAARRSVADAVRVLTETPYGHDVRIGQDLAAAQHAVLARLL